VEQPVLVRQLELECGLKTRSHRLLIAKPGSARLIWAGPAWAQDFFGNRGIACHREPWNRREILEADRGRRWIDGDPYEEDPSTAESGESQTVEYNRLPETFRVFWGSDWEERLMEIRSANDKSPYSTKIGSWKVGMPCPVSTLPPSGVTLKTVPTSPKRSCQPIFTRPSRWPHHRWPGSVRGPVPVAILTVAVRVLAGYLKLSTGGRWLPVIRAQEEEACVYYLFRF
jgi:hypothetical protein